MPSPGITSLCVARFAFPERSDNSRLRLCCKAVHMPSLVPILLSGVQILQSCSKAVGFILMQGTLQPTLLGIYVTRGAHLAVLVNSILDRSLFLHDKSLSWCIGKRGLPCERLYSWGRADLCLRSREGALFSFVQLWSLS